MFHVFYYDDRNQEAFTPRPYSSLRNARRRAEILARDYGEGDPGFFQNPDGVVVICNGADIGAAIKGVTVDDLLSA